MQRVSSSQFMSPRWKVRYGDIYALSIRLSTYIDTYKERHISYLYTANIFTYMNIECDLILRTTLERLLCIVMMFGGVSFFYFVISKINSSFEEKYKKKIQISKHLQILFQLQKKHKVQVTLIKKIKKNILINRDHLLNEKQFLQTFINPLRVKLEYYFYREEMEKIILFRNLGQTIITNIGRNIEKVLFTKGNFVINELIKYLLESLYLKLWGSDFGIG